MSLSDLRINVHNRCLALRCLNRIVENDLFVLAWEQGDQREAERLVKITDVHALKEWMKATLKKNIDAMTYRELREWAKQLKLPRYSQLTKWELICELKEARNET